MAKITVEISGLFEVDIQGWTDDAKLDQVKKQAKDSIKHWKFMVKHGLAEPIPLNAINVKVKDVIIPLD